MYNREEIIIVGAGGYAKSALDSLDRNKYHLRGFIDEREDKKKHLGYPVLGHALEDVEATNDCAFFVAIGNNVKRKRWFDELRARNLEVITIVDKSAIVSPLARMGVGCFVGKLAVVNADVRIGDNAIINSMALVEHGCSISDNVNVSTRAVLNGDVRVGEGSFIGSGSVVIGQLSVGEWTIVGAGATVVKPVSSNITVAGVPARKIRDGANFW